MVLQLVAWIPGLVDGKFGQIQEEADQQISGLGVAMDEEYLKEKL